MDEVGVVGTVLDKRGEPVESELNPARYPWNVVRKVCGERAAAEPTELSKIRDRAIKRADAMAKLEGKAES